MTARLRRACAPGPPAGTIVGCAVRPSAGGGRRRPAATAVRRRVAPWRTCWRRPTPADWRPLDPEQHAVPRARRRPRRDRARAAVCAGARGEHPAPGAAGLFRRARDRPLAGQLRRAVGRPGRQAPLGEARATLPPEFTVSDRRAACPSRGCRTADGYAPEVGFSGRLPGGARPRARAGLARALLRDGRRRARQRRRQRQRRRAVRRDRPRAAPARPQHRAGRAGACRAWSCSPRCRAARGPLGFYEQPAQHVPIRRVRVAADVPGRASAPGSRCCAPTPRPSTALVEARRNRRDDWYKVPAGLHRPVQRAARRCARADGAAAAQHRRGLGVIRGLRSRVAQGNLTASANFSGIERRGDHGSFWLQALSAGRAGRRGRRPVLVARAADGGGLREVRARNAYAFMDRLLHVRRDRSPLGGVRRLAAGPRSRARRARRHHDAERRAVPDRARRRAARGLRRRQRQSALHAARARAPAQGLRRRGDRHPRELRARRCSR